jgi:hypothetical protein
MHSPQPDDALQARLHTQRHALSRQALHAAGRRQQIEVMES